MTAWWVRFFHSNDISTLLQCENYYCLFPLKIFSSKSHESFFMMPNKDTYSMTIFFFIHILVLKQMNVHWPIHPNSAYQENEGMDYPQILYKVCCQGSHFVFRFSRIGATSPASPPSTSSGAPTPRVPHGCMFELHKILEDWITENAARMLGLTSRKWSTSLVKVYGN